MSRIMMPVDNFFRSARRWPKRIAVEILKNDRVQTISYGDLAQTVNALAAALQAIDPEPQSRVGICAYNNYEHLVAWLATYAAGKVWVPLNPRNGIEELDRIIALTEPSIIFVEGHTPAHSFFFGFRFWFVDTDGHTDDIKHIASRIWWHIRIQSTR